MSDTKSPSGGEYEKVAPNLYRHALNGRYYGVKKFRGKRKERSLKTSDRKIAERRLKEWIGNLGKVDGAMEKTTLRELLRKFEAVYMGKSESTRENNGYIITKFKKTWRGRLDVEVREIRPSQLDEWLVANLVGVRNTTYNRYVGFLRQLFDIAVKDRIIAESPVKSLECGWKKPQTPVRNVPTVAEFEAIIATVRANRFTDHAEDTGDFLEFLGAAGLGQAEASALAWGNVDLDDKNRLRIRRQKTDTWFFVPIYDHLRQLLERLKAKAESTSPKTLVFKIKDGKKALASACRTLKLPAYSQRNLRQCLIGRLWKAGVDRKLIAKWQGHTDGGQLIMDTYTETFGSDDDRYERMQLEKLQ